MSKPYELVPSVFSYLDGTSQGFHNQIDPSHLTNYINEVKLIQSCLGADPDGIIGPQTRIAARAAYDARMKRDSLR